MRNVGVTAVCAAVTLVTLHFCLYLPAGLAGRALRVLVPGAVGMAAAVAAGIVLGMREGRDVLKTFGRRRRGGED